MISTVIDWCDRCDGSEESAAVCREASPDSDGSEGEFGQRSEEENELPSLF